jgi:hypothetical protein
MTFSSSSSFLFFYFYLGCAICYLVFTVVSAYVFEMEFINLLTLYFIMVLDVSWQEDNYVALTTFVDVLVPKHKHVV